MTTNQTAGIETTYPYTTSPEVARHQCLECGAWQRSDRADKGFAVGEIPHGRRCESKPQPDAVALVTAERTARIRRNELEKFARNVRKYGLTKGRDQDVLECVRLGLLSQSDAMNTDD